MKVKEKLLRQIVSDLGLDRPFVKGQDIPIKNCWHFSTDGNAVDFMFYDEEDFINGMNRIFVLLLKYDIVILAFILMDPFSLDGSYAPVLQADELQFLGVGRSEDLFYYVMCVVKEPVSTSTVNMRCPVAINDSGIGIQVILENT